ncbi:flagellar hook-length control protein FliK [Dryocola sp. BD626]|uniref:flagellar hook-length control protein FliK n=1 Tax=Dryocola sp. BD626 TaxID=3133273 RepID=UPI003F500DFE
MNIDINALLNGGVALPGRPNFKAQAAEGTFGDAMDERLSLRDLLLTASGEAPLLPIDPDVLPQPVETAPAKAAEEKEAVAPGAISLPPLALEGQPNWQLQQVVTENAAGREKAPPEGIAGGKALLIAPGITPKSRVAAGEKAPVEAPPQTQTPPATVAEKPQNIVMPQTAHAVQETLVKPDDSQLGQTQIHAQRPVQTMDAVARPAPAASTPAAVIPHAVGTPAWEQSLSQQLSVFTRNGIHSAEIKLHPEELGSLQISMRMQQDRAQLQIVSEHPHVRQALEAAIPQLRAALAESGVQLGQTNVSADSSQSAGANAHGQQHGGGQGGFARGEGAAHVEDEAPQQIVSQPLANGYGINTFA